MAVNPHVKSNCRLATTARVWRVRAKEGAQETRVTPRHISKQASLALPLLLGSSCGIVRAAGKRPGASVLAIMGRSGCVSVVKRP